MIIDKITMTGADDTVDIPALLDLAAEFPFLEWGILFVPGGYGTRYPSPTWVKALVKAAPKGLKLCAHIQNTYVDSILLSGWSIFHNVWLSHLGIDPAVFQRTQLNFHAEPLEADPNYIPNLLKVGGRSYIFQVDGVNDALVREWAEAGAGSPLFDVSGGAGILPDSWPKAWPGVYCGYAGGLGPANIEAQIQGPILGAVPGPSRIWLDMESRLRSSQGAVFDLGLCRQVALAAKPYITQEGL